MSVVESVVHTIVGGEQRKWRWVRRVFQCSHGEAVIAELRFVVVWQEKVERKRRS